MDGPPAVDTRAILFTDMVGSTELRSRLGDDQADALRRAHDAMLGSAVTAHGGAVLRWTGDGVKAHFASASGAVAAAIAMQRSVALYGRGRDAVAAFQIRIGLSAGEVTFEDDDAHGVAVIEAARLEALASPGEILATDLVQRLGQRRVDAGFDEVGVHALKGLDQAVVIVRVVDIAVDTASRPLPRALVVDRRFPMVGRAEEVRRVMAGWASVQAGTAATALVAGQPGMGKSRFISQVVDLVHADGALVLAGACESDLAVPYQPFAAAFADVPAGDDELAAAVSDGAGPLGPLFPARRRGGLDDAGPSARFELFEAVVKLVDRLAIEQPLVLVLEDLQWANRSTIQLLRHVLRQASGVRLLILASYRPEEIGATHPLHELLADTTAPLTRIDLAPLGSPEITELVQTRLPAAAPDGIAAFARRVHEESAGSPFFVCELLHHLSATGQLERLVGDGSGDRLPIPDTVREVVGQRLGRLSDEAGPILAAAAVIGLTFDLDLLSAVVDGDAHAVLETLEGVAQVALVSEVGAGRFGFAHAIVRATLLDGMSATRLALAHRNVAEAIEALGRPDHDQLAHHWQLAGGEDKAHEHLELAARRDLEALAYESAAERYETVLRYQQRRPTRDVPATARAWLGVGRARRALGEVDFVDAVQEGGRLARSLGDVDLVAEAAIASVMPGTYFVAAGQSQASQVELCEAALDLLPSHDPRRARVLSSLAAHLTYTDDRDRRVTLIAEAHEIAHSAGDPELIGSVLVAEYLSLWDPTTFARRADIARELARMARATAEPDLAFFAGFFAAICATERGDVAEARVRLSHLAEVVPATHNQYFAFLVERLSVTLDILTGQPEVQDAIDALAARHDGTRADTAGTWSLQTGALARQFGGLGGFAPALRTMLDESAIAATWRAPYGLALLDEDDRDGAMAVLDGFEDPPLDFFWLTIMQAMAELAVGLERDDMVRRLYDALLPFREQLGITASGTLCVGLVATTLGQLAVALGDAAAAIDLLEEAVTRADAMEAQFEAVKARRLLAEALTAAGRPNADVVDEAITVARTHGFVEEEQLLARLF